MLQRAIAERDRDAMGCYPLFTCRDWSALGTDVTALSADLVSLSLVADPLGGYEVAELERIFTDRCVPYKKHFVVNLARPLRPFGSAHHRRNVQRAAAHVEIEICDDPTAYLDDWLALYENLIARHRIRGIAAFSPLSLQEQLLVPGLVMCRAAREGVTVGITLWYVQGAAGYYHLGAYSDRGYQLHASFALFDFALRHLRQRVDIVHLGAGAGAHARGADGLSRFKQGWSTHTRTAWLCGLVFDRERYAQLSALRRQTDSTYFPAYRTGEFD